MQADREMVGGSGGGGLYRGAHLGAGLGCLSLLLGGVQLPLAVQQS